MELKSDYIDLYKFKSKSIATNQEQRRYEFLQKQKEQRQNFVDLQRNLCEIIEETFKIDDIDEDQHPQRTKTVFSLMQSEWLREIPQDLEENWLVKFCPPGFRVLVYTKHNNTLVFNQKQRKILKFKSHLPGGGLQGPATTFTILDCVYNKSHKMLYVLDCIYWNGMSMVDSEASLRFFWLKNKFIECPEIISNSDVCKFRLLEPFPAEKSVIHQQFLNSIACNSRMDTDDSDIGSNLLCNGVVFYHKESHYVFENTPLVGWLFSYMLPEKLGVEVPEEYIKQQPKGYENLEQWLVKLENKKTRKKRSCDKSVMDVTT